MKNDFLSFGDSYCPDCDKRATFVDALGYM